MIYNFAKTLLVMKKTYLLLLISLAVRYSSTAQTSKYKIEGEVTGLKDTEVILAYYFGGKQYAKDTAISNNGKFTFFGSEELEGGMYLVVLPDQKWFDIIISEQKFKFKTSLNNLVSDMTFINSKENTPFYKYLNFINLKQQEISPLREKYNELMDNPRLVEETLEDGEEKARKEALENLNHIKEKIGI